jgi:hypothetical protein
MPVEGPAAEKVREVGSTVEGVAPSTSVQCVAGSHSVATAPGMVEQRPELVDGTPSAVAVRSGGLTPSDPGDAAELLAFNAYVHRAGERMGHFSFRRGLASSETELICVPEGRLVTLERGGVGVLPRG